MMFLSFPRNAVDLITWIVPKHALHVTNFSRFFHVSSKESFVFSGVKYLEII